MASLRDRLHAAQAELQDLRLRTAVEHDRLAADLAYAKEQVQDLSKQLVQIGMIREAEAAAHYAELARLHADLKKAQRPWWRKMLGR
jgi:polyhydroxyalkanoate synthesis regulator phasin